MSNLKRRFMTLLLSLAMIITYMPMSMITAYAATGDIPPHTKKVTDNQDGTYTVSLDVVGEAVKKPNNVNVIVIFDTSGSMNQTRMTAAKNAVNSLANSLYAYNTPSEPNTVEMALVRFATTSRVAQQPTNNGTTFRNTVSGLGTSGSGGTNWEAALQTANNDVSFGDEDQTFAIFVSDGNPTFRTDRNGYNDQYQTGVYGTGQETTQNIARCYETAVDDAKTLANKVTPANFFTIGAFGNVDRMEQLTDDAGSDSSTNYYSASDTAALNKAIADILAKIEMSGIANTEIDDGTTNQVTTTSGEIAKLLEVDTSSFKYYKGGSTWAEAPAAEFKNGAVEWDLSGEGVLENGVRYTVTFDCYPSQFTYDTIAQLKNGDISYDSLDTEIKKYIVDNEDGTYSLRTNTDASLTWDDTRDDAGQQTDDYVNPDPVATSADQLTIKKTWEGGNPPSVELPITVLMDDNEFHTANLSGPSWETSSYISVGIIKNGQALPGAEGHDFSFAELDDTQYRWELDAPTVRPMLINGGGESHTPTMLIKVDKDHQAPSGAATYTIDGATYYADEAAAGLTATNHRRSNLNLKKVVTGEDAPEDATFPFTLKVNNSKAPASAPEDDPEHNSDYWVWFSIQDGDGATVTDATVSGATSAGGGYYFAPSGSEISVEMKADWNLRFTNLPSGTTYSFAEGTTEGFAFDKAENTGAADTTFKVTGTTATGTVEKPDALVYGVTFTNKYEKTNLEITKVWSDANNQDGKRLTADELKAKLTLSPAVQGKEATVTDNGDNTYTIKYTDLPRFNDGEEVEYTVAESAIDGYTTTGSPAKDHGTITNTHTPETTSVTVVKVWDDSNDIGGIRPASINAQLKADGTASGDPQTLNKGNEWTYTWENLPKYKAGKEIVYTADETAVPAGYDKKVEKTTAQDGTITFTVTNTYNPTPVKVDPPVQKVIENDPGLYNKGDFTFTIEATSPADAPMPENTSITNSADYEVEGKTGFYEFGEIEFTMPGTYVYTIKETGSVDGVTNDKDGAKGKTLTFEVTDDGKGNLKVEPTTDQVQFSFTNTYDAEGEASITVTKALEGAAWPSGKKLTFTLTGKDKAPMPEETTAELTAAGAVTFGPIAYKTSDIGKTYEYTVSEDGFGAGWTGSGDITAKVKITDKGDGTLKTEVTYTPDTATITNTYKATGNATIEVTKALKNAAWPEGKELTMTLAGTDSAPMPKTTTAKLTAAGKASFGPIAYTEADAGKSYTYTISEDGFGKGWTGSGDVTATVKVTDNGDGTLKTEVTYSPENATITNTYDASGEATLEVTKAIAGAEWPEGKTLTLTLAGEGGTLPETKTVQLEKAGKASFDPIKYGLADAGKTYTYTISENGFGAGWTGSGDITATVKVTDNKDGTLKTEVTYSPEDATITNTYDASGTATIEATKAIAGAAWPTGKSIKFTLTGKGNAPMPTATEKTLTEAGKASFGPIKYGLADAGKTYTYTISEDGFSDGWSGSGDITATVKVTDNKDGTLKTEVTYSPEDATVTNTYVASGTAVLEATKVIGSAEWPKGKTLTFTLAGEGGTLPETKTVQLTKAGKATFGAITYTEADAGKTYTYTISEDGFGDGWSGSGPVTATVKVTDNGNGTLKTDVTYSPEKAEIINTYKAEGSATLAATKKLTGRAWKSGESYTFTLYDEKGTSVDSVDVTKDGEVSFKALSYTLKDMVDEDGNYASEVKKTYTIKETSELPSGVTKSADIVATVTLTDNGDGTIGTSVSYTNDDTIINTYEAAPVEAEINVKKILTGYKVKDPAVNGDFTMVLSPQDGAPMPEGKDTLETVVTTKEGEGSGVFEKIRYTKVGEYKYTVKEQVPEDKRPGMTYDENEYTVTVKVTDDLNGKLVAAVEYKATGEGEEETSTSVEVTNDFQIKPIDVTLKVKKEIDDQSDSAKDATFTFVLKDKDGETVDSVEVTTKDLEGSAEFKPLTFEKDGEYKYFIQETVSEEQAAEHGWTFDTKEYPVVITIKDNLTKAELENGGVVYNEDEQLTELVVTNIYKADPTTVSDLEVNKTIEDTSGSAYETTFTFTLTGKDGAPMPEDNTASVKGEGKATFKDIEYTKAGEYNYTIKEEASDAKGYIFDTKVYGATVTVKDEKGKLVATVEYKDETGEVLTKIDVVNTYDPEDAKAKLSAVKIVEDYVGSAPDETFAFELVDANGEVVETKTRKNGGPVEFSELTFSKVGTYTYTIREKAGSTPGFKYDTAEYTVTIKVTDPDKDGVLKSSVEGNDPQIRNPYEVPPGEKSVTDDISITKKLTGRDLEEGEFQFVLKEVDGDTTLTASNDANGVVTFPACTFDKVGEYTFTVSEVNGDLDDVTYDTSIFTVVATVTDPHTGEALKVEWSCSNGKKIEFVNDYDEPEEPEEPDKPNKPDTGDHNNLTGWLALMALAAAGGTGLYIKRRREDEE